MAKVFTSGPMAKVTLVPLKMAIVMATVFKGGPMDVNTKAIGKTTNCMAKVFLS
jgi:hypothetical protein